MSGSIIFGKQLFGFKKKQVVEYIENVIAKYNDTLLDKKNEHNNLLKAYEELFKKYNELAEAYNLIQEDKAKIANTLINAEHTAKTIVENSRREAEEEKKKLEGQAEEARENIVIRKRMIRELRMDIREMITLFENDMKDTLKEIEDKLEDGFTMFTDGTESSMDKIELNQIETDNNKYIEYQQETKYIENNENM